MAKWNEQAGKLKERVTFTRETLTPDGRGGNTKTWSTLVEVWANVQPLSGMERVMSDQLESARNYRITIRRNATTAGITTKDRLTWRGKVMNIRFIADEGPKELFLRIDAEAGVAA